LSWKKKSKHSEIGDVTRRVVALILQILGEILEVVQTESHKKQQPIIKESVYPPITMIPIKRITKQVP